MTLPDPHRCYAADDECMWPDCQCSLDTCRVAPRAARPMWGPVEIILIGAVLALAGITLWLGFWHFRPEPAPTVIEARP